MITMTGSELKALIQDIEYITNDRTTEGVTVNGKTANIYNVQLTSTLAFPETLVTADLSGLDTSQMTSMAAMFFRCESLTALNLSGFNTSNVTDMTSMFNSCKSLTSLDVTGFDTSKVMSMRLMFSGCESLTSLYVSGLSTEKVTDMKWMFSDCKSLTSLDVTGFDTSSVTDMGEMFGGCRALRPVDLWSFDTSNVTDMSGMFRGCYAFTSLDVSNFNTSKVTKMQEMFCGCITLSELDLTSFDFSSVTDISYIFSSCYALAVLKMPDVSSFPNAIYLTGMFQSCSALTTVDIKSISFGSRSRLTNLFYGCSSLVSVDMTGWNMTGVTDISGMFYECTSLVRVNMSGSDTSKVTTMNGMFKGCSALSEVDITDIVTTSVTDMSYMLKDCGSLSSIDLSSFNTSKVTSASGLFGSDTGLEIKYNPEFWTLETEPTSYGGVGLIWNDGSGSDEGEDGGDTPSGSPDETPVGDSPSVYLKDIRLLTKQEGDGLYLQGLNKGVPNGIASLDQYGKVPASQLPSALLEYCGQWNAATNTPELSDSTVTESNRGNVYICSTAGTWNDIEFKKGEWIICDGTKWERSTADDLVKSVNGLQGIVELDGSNVKATYEGETDSINNLLPKLGKVKSVNGSSPDDDGDITVDGDNIDITYGSETDTLNNILPKIGKVKSVNSQAPDSDGNITVDGDHIDVTYEGVEDTLNKTIPKLGKVKSVNSQTPDGSGNIQTVVRLADEAEYLEKEALGEIEDDVVYVFDDDSITVSLCELNDSKTTKSNTYSAEKISRLTQKADVVESGNMNAVTSNAVANSKSYSTEETWTGGYWVDGKKIYRKVIQAEITDKTTLNKRDEFKYTHNIPVDTLLTVGGEYEVLGEDNYISIMVDSILFSSGLVPYSWLVTDAIYIHIFTNTGLFTKAKLNIFVEYTKTTD